MLKHSFNNQIQCRLIFLGDDTLVTTNFNFCLEKFICTLKCIVVTTAALIKLIEGPQDE